MKIANYREGKHNLAALLCVIISHIDGLLARKPMQVIMREDLMKSGGD
jgi:hypothetical protein